MIETTESIDDQIFLELQNIIDNKSIRTVFQPIVDLRTGNVYGFEALSRGPKGSPLEFPLELFAAAQRYNLHNQLEALCREMALTNSKCLAKGCKIFINFSPYAIYDSDFKDGTTKKLMIDLDIKQSDVVIELTEKASIDDFRAFRINLEHYRNLGFNVAIDDTGAGYSGLQTIVSLHYNYIKIDRSLIENIDKDIVKKALLEVFHKFSKKINAHIIAEGVETLDELDVLIELGIDYAQGYVIARPEEFPTKEYAASNFILQKRKKKTSFNLAFPVAEVARKGISTSPETTTSMVVKMFENIPDLQSVVILCDNTPIGLVTRELIYSRLATQYGYAIFMGRSIKSIMDDNPMIANFYDSIEVVSKIAMERELSKRYNCIIVEKDDEYFGIVSIRDLMDKLSNLQIEHAKNLNPLTSLPGNHIIESEINNRIFQGMPFSVLYADLSNFKPYNDCYGYKKGDEVLLFTAKIIKRTLDDWGTSTDFLGHIGGDDFIILTTPEKDSFICENIIKQFDSQIKGFYHDKDWDSGFVVARDRKGNISNRPLVSIAIAVVTNENRKLENHLQISELASEIKEHVKAQGKSAYLKDRRRV